MPITKANYFAESNAINLISATKGTLEIAKIPVVGKPDWIIPRALILAIDDYADRIWTYLWQNQDVSVFHLLPRDRTPEKLVVVESITDAHRIGLQLQGEVTFHTVRLTDLRDATEEELQQHADVVQNFAPSDELSDSQTTASPTNSLAPTVTPEQDFVFQPVMFEGELCVVPDLDKLSHYLVDLDS